MSNGVVGISKSSFSTRKEKEEEEDVWCEYLRQTVFYLGRQKEVWTFYRSINKEMKQQLHSIHVPYPVGYFGMEKKKKGIFDRLLVRQAEEVIWLNSHRTLFAQKRLLYDSDAPSLFVLWERTIVIAPPFKYKKMRIQITKGTWRWLPSFIFIWSYRSRRRITIHAINFKSMNVQTLFEEIIPGARVDDWNNNLIQWMRK